MSRLVFSLAILYAATATPAADPKSAASDFDAVAKPFIARHCLECHDAKQAKAGFRIDLLKTDFAAPHAAEEWKEVLDRLNAGEMPPDDKSRPDAEQLAAFVDWINARLRDVDLAAKNAGGRIPMRRLNRDEYANTVRDLLKLDENIVRPLIEDLPGDGTAEGFDRLGAALFFDQTQIERNLDVAAKIAAVAIVTEPPKMNRVIDRSPGASRNYLSDDVEVFPAFTHKIPRGARERVVRGEAVEFLQGGPTYRREYDRWGVISHFQVRDAVRQDGYYRIRIHATIDNRSRTEPNVFLLQYAKDSPIQVEQEVAYDPSGVTEATVFFRGPVNGEVKGPQVLNVLWNHTKDAVIREPKYKDLVSQWTGMRSKLEQAATRRASEAEKKSLYAGRDEIEKQLNAWTGPASIFNPEMDIDRLPRLLIEKVEVEGPIVPDWPPASHKALFFTGDERRDEAYVREIFARLLPRAYRRPVADEEVDAIAKVVAEARTSGGLAFHDAMRVGLQRVLCAPGFQFIEEPAGDHAQPRPLTDYERASRLSYLFWSTMPDEELTKSAAAGKLNDPTFVAAQVERMLADPKSQQFVRNFAGQWLDVREYGAVQPAAEYRDYDNSLEAASKQEPLEFFAEVLRRDLPIISFLDSDFVVVNERLARHYGIEGVVGPEFRRVAIRPEHHRGGVLGMAGLMTFLADGTRTLPMRRASWVLRELFNDPPNNPPPNAGEIQPNTAGENLTVRQRLELHRNDAVCASCHAKLDPFGLALENYDAIGAWRERFNGEGFRGRDAPLLDVSGNFPDGRKFATLEEYKAGLMTDKDKFARAFTIKLLTYALGRPVGYADHELVESLVTTLKQNEYRIRPLIHAVVASDAFQTK